MLFELVVGRAAYWQCFRAEVPFPADISALRRHARHAKDSGFFPCLILGCIQHSSPSSLYIIGFDSPPNLAPRCPLHVVAEGRLDLGQELPAAFPPSPPTPSCPMDHADLSRPDTLRWVLTAALRRHFEEQLVQTGHFTTFGAVVLCVTAHPSHSRPEGTPALVQVMLDVTVSAGRLWLGIFCRPASLPSFLDPVLLPQGSTGRLLLPLNSKEVVLEVEGQRSIWPLQYVFDLRGPVRVRQAQSADREWKDAEHSSIPAGDATTDGWSAPPLGHSPRLDPHQDVEAEPGVAALQVLPQPGDAAELLADPRVPDVVVGDGHGVPSAEPTMAYADDTLMFIAEESPAVRHDYLEDLASEAPNAQGSMTVGYVVPNAPDAHWPLKWQRGAVAAASLPYRTRELFHRQVSLLVTPVDPPIALPVTPEPFPVLGWPSIATGEPPPSPCPIPPPPYRPDTPAYQPGASGRQYRTLRFIDRCIAPMETVAPPLPPPPSVPGRLPAQLTGEVFQVVDVAQGPLRETLEDWLFLAAGEPCCEEGLGALLLWYHASLPPDAAMLFPAPNSPHLGQLTIAAGQPHLPDAGEERAALLELCKWSAVHGWEGWAEDAEATTLAPVAGDHLPDDGAGDTVLVVWWAAVQALRRAPGSVVGAPAELQLAAGAGGDAGGPPTCGETATHWVVPVDPPDVAVGYLEQGKVRLPGTALPFWLAIPLSPFHLRRNIRYLVLSPVGGGLSGEADDVEADVVHFFDRLQAVYQGLGLGRLTPLQIRLDRFSPPSSSDPSSASHGQPPYAPRSSPPDAAHGTSPLSGQRRSPSPAGDRRPWQPPTAVNGGQPPYCQRETRGLFCFAGEAEACGVPDTGTFLSQLAGWTQGFGLRLREFLRYLPASDVVVLFVLDPATPPPARRCPPAQVVPLWRALLPLLRPEPAGGRPPITLQALPLHAVHPGTRWDVGTQSWGHFPKRQRRPEATDRRRDWKAGGPSLQDLAVSLYGRAATGDRPLLPGRPRPRHCGLPGGTAPVDQPPSLWQPSVLLQPAVVPISTPSSGSIVLHAGWLRLPHRDRVVCAWTDAQCTVCHIEEWAVPAGRSLAAAFAQLLAASERLAR
eukprot:EG_transcript_1375